MLVILVMLIILVILGILSFLSFDIVLGYLHRLSLEAINHSFNHRIITVHITHPANHITPIHIVPIHIIHHFVDHIVANLNLVHTIPIPIDRILDHSRLEDPLDLPTHLTPQSLFTLHSSSTLGF